MKRMRRMLVAVSVAALLSIGLGGTALGACLPPAANGGYNIAVQAAPSAAVQHIATPCSA